MAQLPPKVPAAAAANWAFTPQLLQGPWGAAGGGGDFVELGSPTSRGSLHRRSASDSMVFLDHANPFMHSSAPLIGFDRIDDDQLISMFSEQLSAPPDSTNGPPSSTPSSPSDQDSNGDDKIMHMEDAPPKSDDPSSPLDPKRVKRILANRQSAQRSRVRKLHYISELERSVTTLQTEVSALSPRVAYLDHQRLLLNVDNGALKQRLAALAQDKIFKDAHQEALKKEIERLRQKYHHQSMKKMGDNCTDNTTQLQPAKEQLISS